MAERIVIFWRDIPTQVIVRLGRQSEKRELPERFIEAVERAALQAGLRETEGYLREWRRSLPETCGDDLAAEADAALAALQACYDDARLAALVRAAGYDRTAATR